MYIIIYKDMHNVFFDVVCWGRYVQSYVVFDVDGL